MNFVSRVRSNLITKLAEPKFQNFVMSSVGGYAIGFLLYTAHNRLAALAAILVGILSKPDLASVQSDLESMRDNGALFTCYTKDTAAIFGAAIGFIASALSLNSLLGLACSTVFYAAAGY